MLYTFKIEIIMELMLKNQNVNLSYSQSGELEKEEIQTVNYDVLEAGAVIGSATVFNGGFNIQVSGMHEKSIAELRQFVEQLLA